MDKKLILLVDDEPEILTLYGLALKNAGFECLTVANGAEALIVAKEKKPDLILLDLKMPVMDGAETLMKIKSDPLLKDIRVSFLTAFSDLRGTEMDAKFAKEAGACGFIKKGLALDELVEDVKKCLTDSFF